MTKKDLIRRGALAKLETIISSCLESCGRDLSEFHLEMLDDVFSTEEHAEIDYIIEKLQRERDYLELFCLFRGI